MSKLGKQELYFSRYVSVEETIDAIEKVDASSISEVSNIFFQDGIISHGFLGPKEGLPEAGDIPAW